MRIAPLLVLLVWLAGCGFGGRGMVGSGVLLEEDRPASGFSSVNVTVPGALTLRQSGQESVRISGDDNIVREIDIVVEAGVLQIRRKAGAVNLQPRQPLRILVTVRDLTGIESAGSAEISAETLKTSSLSIRTSGSSVVSIGQLTADRLSWSISGSGQLRVAGQAPEQRGDLSGAAQVLAGDLQSARVQVTITGSGEATVRASESLDVRITGIGQVRYFGNPRLSQNISGSGKIERAG
ncbi:MAG: head GIN domain-containing protein [Dehalococcoidia bacterium]